MWMRHVTRMNESCHTYEWVMSHIWMSRVTHVNASCHTYEWVMSHIWMSHVTHMNESWVHRWDAAMQRAHAHRHLSLIRMRHVTHVNEACHTYVTRMNASCHTYECVMSHVWISPSLSSTAIFYSKFCVDLTCENVSQLRNNIKNLQCVDFHDIKRFYIYIWVCKSAK